MKPMTRRMKKAPLPFMGEEEEEDMEATGEEEDGPLIPEVGLRINCARSASASSDHARHSLVSFFSCYVLVTFGELALFPFEMRSQVLASFL